MPSLTGDLNLSCSRFLKGGSDMPWASARAPDASVDSRRRDAIGLCELEANAGAPTWTSSSKNMSRSDCNDGL
jgi:hypothetical protein